MYFLAKDLQEYKAYWTEANLEKKKESGVGLLISKKWKKHLGPVEKFSNFAITASFFFKQLELIVMIIYLLPNNKNYKREVQQEIIRKYTKRRQNCKFIFMKDFNTMVDNKETTEKLKEL